MCYIYNFIKKCNWSDHFESNVYTYVYTEIFTRPEKALPYLFDEQQLVRVRYEAFYNDSTGNLKPVNDMCFHNFGFNLEINSEDKKATGQFLTNLIHAWI